MNGKINWCEICMWWKWVNILRENPTQVDPLFSQADLKGHSITHLKKNTVTLTGRTQGKMKWEEMGTW